uniref:SFRICE_038315 n=1 Tax=Spodoptera frugiperda TaxID=7108 RepID=A0A2H1WTP1_SPOFR
MEGTAMETVMVEMVASVMLMEVIVKCLQTMTCCPVIMV